MLEAMVLSGLRRMEVLGLRLEDVKFTERRVFVAEGKGGHQRIVPVSARFFDSVANYLEVERPKGSSTDRLLVVLKGPNTGGSLSAKGLDQLVVSARQRAGLVHCSGAPSVDTTRGSPAVSSSDQLFRSTLQVSSSGRRSGRWR